MVDEKYPWESKTDMAAFVGIIVSLLVSFGYMQELTIEQLAGINTIVFVAIMLIRQYWPSASKVVLSKSKEEAPTHGGSG